MNINTITLVGHLTGDPEAREAGAENRVARFGLAVNRKAGAGREDEVLFIDVEAWNKTADIVMKYTKRGSEVGVEGRLKLDRYTTKAGEKRNRYYVSAERIHLGQKSEGAGEATGPAQHPHAIEPSHAVSEDDLPF
jgi:single-strand DNA-binding protein